jgi:tRNA(Ile)-lysidine synthase
MRKAVAAKAKPLQAHSRNPKSEIRNPKPESRNPKSAPSPSTVHRPPSTDSAAFRLPPAFESKASSSLQSLQSTHETLRPHLPALVGVSGGRDSVALLRFLISHGWTKLIVCHLNHGLRGRESGQDAIFARRFAERHKLAFEGHAVRVESLARTNKLSIETCARAERDAFFHRMAKKHGTSYVFLAHHAEDQAETVLGNLCRGTGLHGLSGMTAAATDREGLVKLRPLLEVRRGDIDAYVAACGLDYREDSSNASFKHRRNRLRHEALPLLREVCERDVVEIITRCARFAGRDEAFLRESAVRLAQQEGVWETGGTLRITPGLKGAHPSIQARVLRHWLVKILKVKGVGSHEIDGALGLLGGDGVAKMNLPGGSWLRRKSQRLFVEAAPSSGAGSAAAPPFRKASI